MSNDYLENRYTPPNDFCPHPEYWHSPDSEATENEISYLVGHLIRAIQPEFVLETGTYHGHTTREIGLALRDNGHGKLVSIEKDTAEYNVARAYVFGYYNNIPATLLNMNSMDYVPEQNIDFAFFDSWQEGRVEEFMRFYEMDRIKVGTIVAFHDTAPHHQVMRSIQRLENEGILKLITIHSPRGLTIGQVMK